MKENISIKKSVSWAFIESLAPQIIGFAITMTLSRLLTPTDYGLIGMLALFISFAQLFSDLGMSQALIQRRNNSDDDETTVFYLNIIIGMIIMLVLIIISPYVADFFKQPKLENILSVLAIGYFLSSFGIVHNALFNRNLDFKKITIVSVVNTIITGITGVTLAFFGFGVWSLVYASLAGIVARVLSLWALSDWRPKGNWSKDSVKSIWKFSGNILGAGLFTTFVDNLSNILIGKSYSASSLGYYTRSFQLQLLPVSLLTGVLNKVAFPMFSRNQDNKELMLHHLRKSVKLSVFAITFVCALLFLTAKPLVPFLFGTQWLDSIRYLEILAFAGIFYPMNVLLITLIKSTGRSDLFLKVEIIKKMIIMVALFIASTFSIEAMAWSLVLTGFIAYLFNASYAIPLVNYNWKLQFFDVLPTILLFSVGTILTFFIAKLYTGMDNILQIISTSLIFTVIVVPIFYVFRKSYFIDIWDMVMGLVNKVKK